MLTNPFYANLNDPFHEPVAKKCTRAQIILLTMKVTQKYKSEFELTRLI